MTPSTDGQPTEPVFRNSGVHDAFRRLVGLWPFARGTDRIPRELARLLSSRQHKTVIARIGGDPPVWFPFQPGDVGHRAYWYLYEKDVRREMRRFLRPGGVFLDVGAHRGFVSAYALSLVQPGGTVISCEPHPHHARCLRDLRALNPGLKHYVYEMAISDRTGSATLLAAQEEGWHTIVPEFDAITHVPRSAMPVQCSTIDDLLAKHADLKLSDGPPRVVIKIDAEGAEYDILKGASNTLAQPSLLALFIELTGGPSGFREKALAAVQLLQSLGWRCEVIRYDSTVPWTDDAASMQVNLLVTRAPGR